MSGITTAVLLIGAALIVWAWWRNSRTKECAPRLNPDLPTPTDTIELTDAHDEMCSYKCGHDGPIRYTISVYGIELTTDKRFQCPECAISVATVIVIRCALCRLPIFPGQGVALYHKSSTGIHRDVAHWVDDESACGCMAWDCVPCGAFYAGNWNGEAFVPAFGGNTLAEAALNSGDAIVVVEVDL